MYLYLIEQDDMECDIEEEIGKLSHHRNHEAEDVSL